MTRRMLLAGACLLLFGAGSALWLLRHDVESRNREDPTPSLETPAPPATDVADPGDAAASTGTADAGQSTPPPMPPLPADTALADVVATLQPRADAGDAQAACRLALEMLDCDIAGTEYNRRNDQDWAVAADADAAQAARERTVLTARHEECVAIGSETLLKAAGYLEQAARAGNLDAMLRYADGGQFLGGRDGFFLDPAFDRWRRDAIPMLERAFAAGRPEAIGFLRGAYGSDAGLVYAFVVDDPERAFAYELLQAHLAGTPEPDSPLDAAATERARRRAGEWQAGPFAATPVPTQSAWVPALWRARLHGDPLPCTGQP